MGLAVHQAGHIAVLVTAAEEEPGHAVDLLDKAVRVGGGDVLDVDGDPLRVGRAVPSEEVGAVGAVAGGFEQEAGSPAWGSWLSGTEAGVSTPIRAWP
ncbi:hypothetical protein [Streptomyces sp. A0642]|uniref:hypothetical protein n=1 Tax=Streptomyces sp. A0642 TaxID=2563100 RepID=UPI001F115FC0|nr:hypothetical protein [Streptomyces sp. A0642]